MTTIAEVRLWGRRIGAVSLADGADVALFQYDPAFVGSGIQVAPLTMPLSDEVRSFPALPSATFRGLPGLVADSLLDRFGNALVDVWLATQGRRPEQFNAVERLSYVGSRGMGALEYRPAVGPHATESSVLLMDGLVRLASDVLAAHGNLSASLADEAKGEAMREILHVGTSAGGARAKAVIAWDPRTNEVRSGQVKAPPGFEYWLLKFDGVEGNRDKEEEDPHGYCAIEYAYSIMAKAAGVRQNECRLLEENGRRHFMTRRFDRLADGSKLHMLTLGAIAHYDFNAAGAHSYEQALQVIRRLGLGMDEVEEQFRRMVFNVAARNQDDHVKNIAFLMDRRGAWSLAPAFDVTYSFNPRGLWTARHQMSINGKRDGFTVDDLQACAASASMQRGAARRILGEVTAAVSRWREFAQRADVSEHWTESIQANLRLDLGTGGPG